MQINTKFNIGQELYLCTDLAAKHNQCYICNGNEKEITDAINNYLSTVPEFEGYYSIPLENELDKVDELLNQEDFSKTDYIICTNQFIRLCLS